MPWPRALAYAAAGLVLGIVYFVILPPPQPPAVPIPRVADAEPPAMPAIEAVQVQVADRTVRAERDGGAWDVTEPAGAEVPPDLVAALVSAVLESPAEAVATGDARLAEFGLETPTARITFARPDAAPITVLLGVVNPTETGVYGRLDGSDQVLLLGMNVRYYVDLLLAQSAS